MESFWIYAISTLFVGIVTAFITGWCYHRVSRYKHQNAISSIKEESRRSEPAGGVGSQTYTGHAGTQPKRFSSRTDFEKSAAMTENSALCNCKKGDTTHRSKYTSGLRSLGREVALSCHYMPD